MTTPMSVFKTTGLAKLSKEFKELMAENQRIGHRCNERMLRAQSDAVAEMAELSKRAERLLQAQLAAQSTVSASTAPEESPSVPTAQEPAA